MRALFLLVVSVLTGCASNKSIGPGSVPPDAIGAMYTDMSADRLASCFAQAIGGNVRPEGTRFLISSPLAGGTSYDVGANATEGTYPTELIVRGVHNPAEEQRGGSCFSAGSAQR